MLKDKLLFAASEEIIFPKTLYAWGLNNAAATGLGITTGVTLVPTQVNSNQWKQVSTDTTCTFAIAFDNTLWSWGDNVNGQTGLGLDAGVTLVPTQIGTDADWRFVARTSGSVGFAIKENGTMWSWGLNDNGRTALGTTVGNTLTPVQVGTDTDWKMTGSSTAAGIAIKNNNTIWSWGLNGGGRTGQGTTVGEFLVPTQIGTDTDWFYVSPGGIFSIAVKTDGTLWSWGVNLNGRTGLGTVAGATTVPTQIGTDTDWVVSSGGNNGAGAIKSNGTLWTWGSNANGSTGLGISTGNTLVPTQVGTDTDWIALQIGANMGFALKQNGTLWAWGINDRLGINIAAGNTLSPIQVDSETDWVSITAYNGLCGLGLRLS